MFKNYLTIAFRNIQKHPGYSLLNILGLTIGLACFLLILLFVRDELSYDRYHEKADRIYRVVEVIEEAERSSSQPFSVAPTLLTDYPDLVQEAVRIFNFQAPVLTLESSPARRFNESRIFFVDSTALEVFDFALVRGDRKTALSEPNSILITEEMAEKYFRRQDAMGKTLRYEDQLDLKVTGVLKNTRANSHFKYDFLISFSTVRTILGGEPRGWYWNPCWTYLLLPENVPPDALEAQFPAFVDKYFPERIKDKVALYLQPLTDIHLRSKLDFEIEPNSDITYVYVFSAIAVFILLIACINFMNLATARSARRAREVGMRKVLGAFRGQLIKQFIGESLLLAVIAVILAVPLVKLALPVLNPFMEKSLDLSLAGDGQLLLLLAGVTLLVGVVAGIYPALLLSAFQPGQVLKGTMKLGNFDVANLFRKALVVLQFTISVMLIVGTLVAYRQLQYFQNARLGFDKEQIVMVSIQRTPIIAKYQDFKNQLLANKDIIGVTVAEDVVGSKYQTNTYQVEGEPEPRQYHRMFVRRDFIETLGMELLAGRDFSESFPSDDSSAVIINEAMLRHQGWSSPAEALGKIFRSGGPQGRPHQVVGVVKDFHYTSLRNPIAPFVIDVPDTPGQHQFFNRYLTVRIAGGNVPATLNFLERKWTEFVSNRPFEFFFMDEDLEKLYRAERKLGAVAGGFSLFAIFVACLGLFGLAAFTAEQRTKEIGVRKVLGASVMDIFLNLSREFMLLVGAGILLAWPIAYFATESWLQVFANRITLTPFVFIVAGGIAILIAWLTVGYQALRAALTNPVDSLKYE